MKSCLRPFGTAPHWPQLRHTRISTLGPSPPGAPFDEPGAEALGGSAPPAFVSSCSWNLALHPVSGRRQAAGSTSLPPGRGKDRMGVCPRLPEPSRPGARSLGVACPATPSPENRHAAPDPRHLLGDKPSPPSCAVSVETAHLGIAAPSLQRHAISRSLRRLSRDRPSPRSCPI